MTNFPAQQAIIDFCFQMFHSSKKPIYAIIPVILLLRVNLIMGLFKDKSHFGQLFKDTIQVYAGLYLFEEVLRVVLELPSYAQEWMGNDEIIVLKNAGSPTSFFGWISWTVADFLKYLGSVIYWVMNFIYIIFVGVFIMMGAFIIFFSTMFRMTWLMSAAIFILLTISTWPFFWYGIDQILAEILRVIDGLGSKPGMVVTAVLGGLVKITAPIVALLYALKNPVGLAQQTLAGFKQVLAPTASVISSGVNAAKTAGKAVGADLVYNQHIKPRVENESKAGVISRIADSTRHITPIVSYGAMRAVNSDALKVKVGSIISSQERILKYGEYKSALDNALNDEGGKEYLRAVELSKTSNSSVGKPGNAIRRSSQTFTRSERIEKARSLEDVSVVESSENIMVQGKTRRHTKALRNLGFQESLRSPGAWFYQGAEPENINKFVESYSQPLKDKSQRKTGTAPR